MARCHLAAQLPRTMRQPRQGWDDWTICRLRHDLRCASIQASVCLLCSHNPMLALHDGWTKRNGSTAGFLNVFLIHGGSFCPLCLFCLFLQAGIFQFMDPTLYADSEQTAEFVKHLLGKAGFPTNRPAMTLDSATQWFYDACKDARRESTCGHRLPMHANLIGGTCTLLPAARLVPCSWCFCCQCMCGSRSHTFPTASSRWQSHRSSSLP